MKTARSFRIVAPLDNDIATMEQLHMDIQSLDESFAILSVNKGSNIISNSGISR